MQMVSRYAGTAERLMCIATNSVPGPLWGQMLKMKFLKNNWGKVLFCIWNFRTFALSKDEAAEPAIKDKKLWALNLEIARINGSKIFL